MRVSTAAHFSFELLKKRPAVGNRSDVARIIYKLYPLRPVFFVSFTPRLHRRLCPSFVQSTPNVRVITFCVIDAREQCHLEHFKCYVLSSVFVTSWSAMWYSFVYYFERSAKNVGNNSHGKYMSLPSPVVCSSLTFQTAAINEVAIAHTRPTCLCVCLLTRIFMCWGVYFPPRAPNKHSKAQNLCMKMPSTKYD